MTFSSKPPSSTSTPDAVVGGLTELRDTARSVAGQHLALAQDAQRAIEAVKWGVNSGSVTSFPAFYLGEIDSASARIREAGLGASSAQSTVQLIVSGTTSRTVQGAIVSTEPILLSAPTFQRLGAMNELDSFLQQLWDSPELGNRRAAAWVAAQLGTEDSAAQACHTMREILTDLLDRFSRPADVRSAPWWTPVKGIPDGVSKAQKVRYFMVCRGQENVSEAVINELVEQVEGALDAHRAVIRIAHHKTSATLDGASAALADLEEVMLSLIRYRREFATCL